MLVTFCKSHLVLLWCILLVVEAVDVVSSNEKKNVTLILVDREELSKQVAEFTVKTINDNDHILPNLRLKVFQVKSRSAAGDNIRILLYELGELNDIIAVLGPLSSTDITITNQIAAKRFLLQVNYNALNEDFSNKEKYPFLFNSCQLYNTYESSAKDILLFYDWKKIGVFYQSPDSLDELIFYESAQLLERYLRKHGITDITLQGLSFRQAGLDLVLAKTYRDEYRNKLKIAKDKDIRIFINIMNRLLLRAFFCEVYHLGMYGPKYMYIIFYSHGFDRWFAKNETRCKDEDLLKVADSAIFLDRLSSAPDDTKTVSNETVGEIWQKLSARNANMDRRKLFLYDGIWAFALSLQKMLQQYPTDVQNLNIKSKEKLEALARQFESVDFQGATGHFKYINDSMKRIRTTGDLVVRQFEYVRGDDGIEKGTFTRLGTIGTSGTHLGNISSLRRYHEMPRDRPKVIKEIKRYSNVLIITVWIFCGFGISLAFLFFLTNVVYRNSTFIKLSSPNINSLICFGCIVLYAAVILYGLDTNIVDINYIPGICNATVLLLCMGFTLTFGSLFSKTWRIYRIFSRTYSLRSKGIKDVHLFSIVLILLMIDLLVFIVWVTMSPYELSEQVMKIVENKTLDTIEKDIYHRCHCEYQSVFLSIMFAYKGLLMLFGLFVAYETRSIAVEAINDAKYIGMAVYNVSLFILLSSILVYALYDTDQYQVVYAVFACGIIEATTVTLCFVFIPKINMIFHEDYDDPNFRNGRPVMYYTKSGINEYSDNYSTSRRVSTAK